MPSTTKKCAKCGVFISRCECSGSARATGIKWPKSRSSAGVRARYMLMKKPTATTVKRSTVRMIISNTTPPPSTPLTFSWQQKKQSPLNSSTSSRGSIPPFKGVNLGLKLGQQQSNQHPEMTDGGVAAISIEKFQGFVKTTNFPNLFSQLSPASLMGALAENHLQLSNTPPSDKPSPGEASAASRIPSLGQLQQDASDLGAQPSISTQPKHQWSGNLPVPPTSLSSLGCGLDLSENASRDGNSVQEQDETCAEESEEAKRDINTLN